MDLDKLRKELFGDDDGNVSSSPETYTEDIPLTSDDVDFLADEASKKYNVPKALIRSVIDTENPKYLPKAKNPNSSATGLMQLIGSTAKYLGVNDPADPFQNVMGGTKYLKELLDKYDGDQDKAVAAYFKGTGIVDEHLKNNPDVSTIPGTLGGTTASSYLNSVKKGMQKYEGEQNPVQEIGPIGETKPKNIDVNNIDYLTEQLFGSDKVQETPAQSSNVQSNAQIGATGTWENNTSGGATGKWEDNSVKQPSKKQLPVIGDAWEMLKTLARVPYRTIRGATESIKQMGSESNVDINNTLEEVEKNPKKYSSGISSEDPMLKSLDYLDLKSVRDAKEKNSTVNYSDFVKELKSRTSNITKGGFYLDAITESAKDIENSGLLKKGEVQRLPGAGGVAQDIAGSVTQVAAQLGMSVVSPPLATASMISLISGTSLDELEQKGVAPDDAMALSMANSALQYPLEKLGLEKIAHGIDVKSAAGNVIKRIVSSMAGEGATEAMQEVPDYVLTDWWVKTKGKDLNEKIDTLVKDLPELGKSAGYSGFIGGITGGAVTGAGIGAQKLMGKTINEGTQTNKPEENKAIGVNPEETETPIANEAIGALRNKIQTEQQQPINEAPNGIGQISKPQETIQNEEPSVTVEKENEVKPTIEETKPEIVEPTEQQKENGKNLVKNISDVEFTGANPGVIGINQRTGERIEKPVTYDFKDKVSGGNITLTEDELSPDIISKKLEEKRATVKPETPEKEVSSEEKISKKTETLLNETSPSAENKVEDLTKAEGENNSTFSSKQKQESSTGTSIVKGDTIQSSDGTHSGEVVNVLKIGGVKKFRIKKDDGTTKIVLAEGAVKKTTNSNNTAEIKRPESEKVEIQSINTEPTEAQKVAGNYRKAHIKRDGFEISVENAFGSERKGKDEDGNEWSNIMGGDYGYIKGTKGADAYRDRTDDQVDTLVKPGSKEGGDVFVVNQVNPKTGKFDEHKVMMGYDNESEAKKAYMSSYDKNWKGFKSIVKMPMDKFKEWVYSPATKNELTANKEDAQPVIEKHEEINISPESLPKSKDIVDGLKVRKEIPNTNSIGASLNDYTELEGVREISISNFELTGKSYSKSETDRIAKLADEIQASGEINPLIVVKDKEGYYILEGGHRAEALFKLGKKTIPAKIVVDNESVADTSEIKTEQPEPEDNNTVLVNRLKDHLKSGKKFKNTRDLLNVADEVHGGTIAQGKYGIRNAYDAIETAMNKHIAETKLSEDPKENFKKFNEYISLLPTQTVRTEDQVEKQQFSTPPSEAYLATLASGIKPGMTGLEPSAGDGNIATMMKLLNKDDGEIHTNEIDDRRRNNLKVLGFNPTNKDAEYLNSTLPENIKPDVVVMNPPFSSTGGRLKSHDTSFGAEHVRQALLRLKDGGRLVAIVGRGMDFDRPKMKAWWNKIAKDYNVRANVGISGKEYTKYGTGFDNNIIVIDKTGKTEDITKAVSGKDLNIDQAYDILEPLMKEDIHGRIKGNVSGSNKEVGKGEEKRTSSEKPSVENDTTTGSGREGGVTESSGRRAKRETVASVDKSGSELPGQGRGNTTEDIGEGGKAGKSTEENRVTDEGSGVVPGSGNTGGTERKLERTELDINTKEFKDWFSGSDIVDENGNPLIVYHGSNAEKIDTFDMELGGKNYNDEASKIGVFFTKSREDAKFYGKNIHEFYVNIKRPKLIDENAVNEYTEEWLSNLEENDPEEYEYQIQTKKYENGTGINKGLELAIVDAKKRGYDGVILNTENDNWVIAFSPTQIKSVISYKEKKDSKKLERTKLENSSNKLEEESGGVYAKYKVRKAIYKGAKAHPANISESVTMASVNPPDVTYQLTLPKKMIESGALSDVQLEAVTYACQAHEQRLPDGRRKEYLLGDGCVSKETKIFNPITNTELTIEELARIGKTHIVLAITKHGFVPAYANAPFVKGVADLFKVTLENGKSIVVTNNHKFLTPNGWMRIIDGLKVGSFLACEESGLNDLEVSQSIQTLDAANLNRKAEDCLDHYCYDYHLCGEQLLSDQDIDQESFPLQGDAPLHILPLLQTDDSEILEEYNHHCQSLLHHSKSSSYQEENRDLSLILYRVYVMISQLLEGKHEGAQQFLVEIKSLLQKDLLVEARLQELSTYLFQIESEVGRCFSVKNIEQHQNLVQGTERYLDNCCQVNNILLPFFLRILESFRFFSYNKNSRWNRITSIEYIKTEEYYDMYVPGIQNYVAEGIINHNTGMGKARTLLAAIQENWGKGVKKHVWITKSKDLINQMKSDMESMGIEIPVIPLENYKLSDKIEEKEGILFTTYSTASKDFNFNKPRYNQIMEWMGKDSDGVVVFDEAHMMKNVSESRFETENENVKKLSEGSLRGMMGITMKNELPNARFINASATAATEPVNLAYLTRLGLWGEGTSFDTFISFLNTMRDGGVGAMELLARDMKTNGTYLSRSISYDGVNYDTVNHTLSKDEEKIYNDMADFWSEILVKMEEAGHNAGMKKGLADPLKQFYSAQQRFFLQLMMSFQVETMLKDADTQLKDNKSVVISLFNTNEQSTDKKVNEAIANGVDIDSMDFSPKDMMKQMIEKNFPIYQYEEYEDENGQKGTRPVKDDAGNPLVNKENYDMQQDLIEKVVTFKTPENPLDRIINHFGYDKVSEITGRKKRIVVVNGKKEYRERAIKGVPQKKINQHELSEFMDGKKRVAVISGAAATGFDLHASLKRKNQQRRVFYALQLSWSADEQMQAFGRVHRTMQANAPEISLVKTNIASQQRLINTVQSRLASLGAISKGGRESLSGGIFSIEDITDQYGQSALNEYIRTIDTPILKRMNVLDKKEGNIKNSALTDVSGFLNRIMVLPIKQQNEVFDGFYKKYRENVEYAIQKGTYDVGVEKLTGSNMKYVGSEVLNTDESTGVKTELVTIEADHKVRKESFGEINQRLGNLQPVKNKKTGVSYLVKKWEDGNVTVYSPKGSIEAYKIDEIYTDFRSKYERAEDDEVKKSWKEQYDKIPEKETKKTVLITGSIFPHYKKIFFDEKQQKKVKRAVLPDGSSYIGIEVNSKYIPKIKQNFGIGSKLYDSNAKELLDLINAGSIIELDNGWKLSQKRVQGENRIEIDYGRSYVTVQAMERLGTFEETINYNRRFFIPTEESKAVETIGKIISQYKPTRDMAANTEYASAPLEIKEYTKEQLEEKITPDPVETPVQKLITSNSNISAKQKIDYATASAAIGKHIAWKKGKNKDTGFLGIDKNFYQKWVDLAFPISKVEDVYNEDMGITREDARKIDLAIDRVRGAGGISKQFIDDNLKPIFDSIKDKRSEVYTELNKYFIAKRTAWLYENKKDEYIDGGLDLEKANTMIEFVETGVHPHSNVIQRIAPQIWEYNKKLLQIKREHGIIDDQLLSQLSEPYYVPFYRDVESATSTQKVPRGERYTATSKGIKRISGSVTGRKIKDPIQNMMQNTYETMVNAYRADVANMLVDMAEKSDAIGEMFEKIPPKWVKMGTIEYRGEVDLQLRPQLEELAKALGITTEYKAKLKGRVAGKTKKLLGKYSTGKLETLIGATEETYSHELGHGIHEKFKWYDNLVDKYSDEFNAVADTRYLGVQVPANYVAYCRSKEEKAAEFISMYITDRENLKNIAPNAVIEFETHIALDKNLRKMFAMKPSNMKGINSLTKDNWVMDWHVPQDRDVVSVLREGKIVSYRVPIEVADAVKNLHPAMFPAWFRILMIPMRILRKGAVTFNLGFIIPNSFRDQQDSAINARTIPVYDWFIGLKEYITNGDIMKQYYRMGGGMESVEAGTKDFQRNSDELKYGKGKYLDPAYWQEEGLLKGLEGVAWSTVKFPFNVVSTMAEASEMATRLGTFRRAQVGVPDWLKWYAGEKKNAEQAIHIARQATIDFQRFGQYGRTLNEIIPFINAAIQGWDKMARTFKDDPKRALLSAMLYVITPMIGFWLWNKDKEKYKAIPLQEKINNYIFMSEDGEEYYKIPKSHIAKFICNPIQIALEKMNGTVLKDDIPAALQILENLSPVDAGSIPVSLRMLIEPIANYDLYWQKEIERPAVKGILTPGMKYDKRTSELMKSIGKALNISPIMMQHEVELVGAGTAKNILWIADVAMGKMDAEKLGIDRVPVTKSFYGKVTEWGGDIDDAIRKINVEISKTKDVKPYQLNKSYGYSREEIRKVYKSNAEKIKLLYIKRRELMKAKNAIIELKSNKE